MRILILTVFSLAILSCKTNKDKYILSDEKSVFKQTDSVEMDKAMASDESESYELDFIKVDTGIKKDLIDNNYGREILSNLNNWVEYYKKMSSKFNIKDFRNFKTSVIQPYQDDLGDNEFQKRFFNLYNPYLFWAPDSSKAIDLYSYSIILDYDSQGNVIGMRDVDSKLALVDVKKQKRINILTYGPAGEFQDAFWVNNDSFIVTSIEFDVDNTYEPLYSVIDLKTYLKRDYKLDYKLRIKKNSYVEGVFKEVTFE